MENENKKPSSLDSFSLDDTHGSSSDDFKFVQENSKIHEQRFNTKPVSFFADSLRRFARSKSSVVAFIIIGIIFLFAIVVPFADSNGVDSTSEDTQLAFITPKWYGFEKAGFLDGGRNYEGVIYDQTTKLPVGYDEEGLMNTPTVYTSTISNASQYGYGGNIMLMPIKTGEEADYISPSVTLTKDGDYSISFSVLSTPTSDAYSPSQVELYFLYENIYGEETKYFLVDPNKDYLDNPNDDDGTAHVYTVDNDTIQNAVFGNSMLTSITGNFFFAVLPDSTATNRTGAQFSGTAFSNANDSTDPINDFGWTSANEVKLRTGTSAWTNNGDASLQGAYAYFADFRYDTYYNAFKDRTVNGVSDTYIRNLISQGLISYDFDTGAFSMLSDDSPVRAIISRTETNEGRYDFTVTMSYYRYKGYKTVPYFLFGTNQNGLDYFKLIFTGLRTSLILGIVVTLICIAFGMIWGAISAYFGGWTDIIMERFTDILSGVPWIVVMTLFVLLLKSSFGTLLLAFCFTGWIGTASFMRSQVYRYKRREYVLAARTLGANDIRLIFRHIVPNAIGPIVTSSVLMIPSVIMSEASLAYLGLLSGLSFNGQALVSFGVTISEVQQYLQSYSYLTISSSIIIALMMICFNLFGNGLRDAFNPSLKGSDSEL